MPFGPRCLRWSKFNLSGPKAEEFEDFLMASMTRAGVKGEKLGFKVWILRNLRINKANIEVTG